MSKPVDILKTQIVDPVFLDNVVMGETIRLVTTNLSIVSDQCGIFASIIESPLYHSVFRYLWFMDYRSNLQS